MREFIRKNEGVERDITAHAAQVEKFREAREVRFGEIMGAHARVKFFEAEVDRVRAILDCGFGAFPITGGGKQFLHARRDTTRIGRGLGWNRLR